MGSTWMLKTFVSTSKCIKTGGRREIILQALMEMKKISISLASIRVYG